MFLHEAGRCLKKGHFGCDQSEAAWSSSAASIRRIKSAGMKAWRCNRRFRPPALRVLPGRTYSMSASTPADSMFGDCDDSRTIFTNSRPSTSGMFQSAMTKSYRCWRSASKPDFPLSASLIWRTPAARRISRTSRTICTLSSITSALAPRRADFVAIAHLSIRSVSVARKGCRNRLNNG